ncbi:MAG TPA: hypothetical protein VF544_13390 [Pyrinomonadaceae bacterium]
MLRVWAERSAVWSGRGLARWAWVGPTHLMKAMKARGEREYVRERLREELGREPAQEELDEWLRRHTEGY